MIEKAVNNYDPEVRFQHLKKSLDKDIYSELKHFSGIRLVGIFFREIIYIW